MSKLVYTAAYYDHSDDEGWFGAQVLDFPGAISQGRTLDKARRNLADALREMAEWHLEDGLPLPPPVVDIRDPEATILEPIRLLIRARSGVET